MQVSKNKGKIVSGKATEETRYDAFMNFWSINTGNNIRLYLPFVVEPGDMECVF
jgi:hypothetical protein